MRNRVVVQQGRRRRSYVPYGNSTVGGGTGGRGERLARALWGAAEAAVTCGIVVLLLVVHQLWWTNREAQADARQQVTELQRQWDTPAPETPAGGSGESTREPGADGTDSGPDGTRQSAADGRQDGGTAPAAGPQRPRWEGAYAVMRIPKLGVTAPVAQGVAKAGVLNKGYIGHYPQTAGPGQAGNFAVAGHRNTHGEPFRYINRLRSGDAVRVETREARYVYSVRRTVAQTTPGDGTVLNAQPYSSVHPRMRMSGPGYYLTMTTCTPEYTSRYRLVVWAELRSVAPR